MKTLPPPCIDSTLKAMTDALLAIGAGEGHVKSIGESAWNLTPLRAAIEYRHVRGAKDVVHGRVPANGSLRFTLKGAFPDSMDRGLVLADALGRLALYREQEADLPNQRRRLQASIRSYEAAQEKRDSIDAALTELKARHVSYAGISANSELLAEKASAVSLLNAEKRQIEKLEFVLVPVDFWRLKRETRVLTAFQNTRERLFVGEFSNPEVAKMLDDGCGDSPEARQHRVRSQRSRFAKKDKSHEEQVKCADDRSSGYLVTFTNYEQDQTVSATS